jgi:hypothetical protein
MTRMTHQQESFKFCILLVLFTFEDRVPFGCRDTRSIEVVPGGWAVALGRLKCDLESRERPRCSQNS